MATSESGVNVQKFEKSYEWRKVKTMEKTRER